MNENGDMKNISMDITYNEGVYDPLLPQTIYLNQNNLSIFDEEPATIKKFLQTVSSIRLIYHIKSIFVNELNYSSCFAWDIVESFMFEQRILFTESLKLNNKICSNQFENSVITWANISVIIISLWSLILSWKYVYSVGKLYRKLKTKYTPQGTYEKDKLDSFLSKINAKNNNYKDYLNKIKDTYTETNEVNLDEKEVNWDNIRYKDKSSIINLWNILSIIGNTFQLIGSIIFLFDKAENFHITTTLIGIGCMLAWINIIRYIQFLPSYYGIYSTIKSSMPYIINILIGIIPIYVGFALLGINVIRLFFVLGV